MLLLLLALAFYRIANVFNRVSNFPSSFPEVFLDVATGVFSTTLVLEFWIVESAANAFLGFAFYLIKFSFDFIPIR
jgi:hypothetical protein